MNWVDIAILVFVIITIGLILFFNIKGIKENRCTKCPYADKCCRCCEEKQKLDKEKDKEKTEKAEENKKEEK